MKKINVMFIVVACFYFLCFGMKKANAIDLTFKNNDLVISTNEQRLDSFGAYTPNGTEVVVIEEVEEQLSPTQIQISDATCHNNYPNAIRIHSATSFFNCHSYAWYSQDTSSNHYWIENPMQYYYDQSYEEVTTPRVGDIVCYYEDYGTPETGDDKNIHSGIVIEYYPNIQSNGVCGDVNKVKVESKWGYGCIFQHMGDYCLYVSSNNDGADYVKYFRPRTHEIYGMPDDLPVNENFTSSGYIELSYNHYEMYELNITNTALYDFDIYSTNELDVRLYDEHMQLVNYLDLDIDDESVIFTIQLNSNKIYYLRVAYEDITRIGTIYTNINNHTHAYSYSQYNSTNHQKICIVCGYTEYENHHFHYNNGNDVCSECGYTKTHQHSYDDHYEWTSLTNHRAYCSCGNYINDFHIVSPDAFQNGFPTAPCLLCHGFASIAGTWHEGISNYPYTLNGSFILPNGVIVLVEEDFEAYMNGTLIFINSNENIDRGNNYIPFVKRKEQDYFENVK